MEISLLHNFSVYAELAEFPLSFQGGLQSDPQRWKTVAEDIRALMYLLGVTPTEMQKKQSVLPVPDRYDAGKGWRPRKISMGTLSGWLTGKEPWPPFRIAAAVAMLELLTLQTAVQLATQLNPDTMLAKRIELAQKHHERLGSEPSLFRWLSLHRLAIHDQLKRNRKKSAKHQTLFEQYDSLMPPEVLREIAKQTPAHSPR